ncbi:MAG: tRNA uridine-5-carboxymethylaminomethyl(34) synthesis enzyme MnmG, partial [Planktomarina sp.]|nr:tRNA uridine-5-carboxymethylaminomethyl(34) synthesis enzyme MnmG [Planktomarina sp.]
VRGVFHVKHFDVVVVGGGHAGCEAIHAACRYGLNAALVTLDKSKTGSMSCNPAIGGLGKGHLVREIDALDGIMGRAADVSGIQFRLLNRSRGPAVQGPRTQSDRKLYLQAVQNILEKESFTEIEGEVAGLLSKDGRIDGVVLSDGTNVHSNTVILTAGTFMRGVIHIGDKRVSAGRMGEAAADHLSNQMEELGAKFGRLKTGTPPRLNGNTINWEVLESQPADDDPVMLSFLSQSPSVKQVSCGITHTNQNTHEVIKENLGKSAMYGGHIAGVGPRYCPSIEDKIIRFPDKQSHQIFLEPEGLTTNCIYPNGISTSLPETLQHQYVRSIVGLENVEILQPGYAIEYDFMNPMGLSGDLESNLLDGLFLAGQINGTTGYEEAAAQGLVAAIGVAKKIKDVPGIKFNRSSSYIGVMIDDLTSRGASEPYRMFTSRAEFRLKLRADNADQRLTEQGWLSGCVSEVRYKAYSKKMEGLVACKHILSGMSVSPNQARSAGIDLGLDGRRRNGHELLAIPGVSVEHLADLEPAFAKSSKATKKQAACEAVYVTYIERQRRDVEALAKDLGVAIPPNFNYSLVSGLSSEMISKLSVARPRSLGAAKNIEGVTPAALTAVLLGLKGLELKKAI